MTIRLIDNLREVDSDSWNALIPGGYPFANHAFLCALEESRCVHPSRGWQPCHLLLEENHSLRGAAPLYLKSHSRGEFVFDWLWADAHQRMGLHYYPKLVNAIPFTPATGPRLLADSETSRTRLAHALREQAQNLQVSSLHSLFLDDRDRIQLGNAGFQERTDCNYRWRNHGYENFEHFLSSLSASRRKKIRRERRRVREAGITMKCVTGAELNESLWQRVYDFYASTYHLRGQRPYLSLEFWLTLARRMGEQLIVFLAYHDDLPVAAALTLRDDNTLYGRHWGCAEDYHSLHFEACYYQGIEYCIEHGLNQFDAGVQGPHKIHRGFDPVITRSAHWVAEPMLRDAIGRFLDQESELVTQYQTEQREHTPYRNQAPAHDEP